MKSNRNFIMVILTVVLVILAACGDSSDGSNATSSSKSSNNSLTQNPKGDSTNKDLTDTDETETEKPSGSTDNIQNDDENTSDQTSTNSNDGNGEITEGKKDEYLKIINDTKIETNEMEAEDTSTYAMKKVENDRWDIWDVLLNEIYGVLREQLPAKEMDQLREEQQNWLKHRDDSALGASLKYKGGTQEQLEYVIVLANLTEERCYELVANYMK